MITLFAFSGLLIGLLLVPASEGNRKILAAGGLLIIAAFIILIRSYIVKQKKILKTSRDREKSSEVGFVVDTFHELVAKLKEKEKELEKLKAFAEEKAGRIEAYNDHILQSVPSGVISVDNRMEIKSINQAAEHILHLNAKDVIGKNFNEVFREPLTKLTEENKTVSRCEYQYITSDQRHIWLGITTSQLKNARGEKIGLIFIFTDLTDIKALQAQVELRQRLSQLGEMSAGISHELRNSMSVISGYAKLLSKKLEPSHKGTMDAIIAEISHMDRIISELLAFAKPSVLNTDRIDLNEMIEETAASVAGGNNAIRVSVKAHSQVTVEADAVLLRQAFANLFINAVEAMPGGGNLDIELSCQNNKAEINIRDTGCGIAEDIKQKIFLPFYSTKENGIGFGLALVQKIIVSHGGSIEVDSTEGRGATFRITLPAAA
ncbi:MAG: PAS domain-containing protein [Deferribacteres bacterium]|nr:PAS domain-containing protein [Deferribacteres bacterium]